MRDDRMLLYNEFIQTVCSTLKIYAFASVQQYAMTHRQKAALVPALGWWCHVGKRSCCFSLEICEWVISSAGFGGFLEVLEIIIISLGSLMQANKTMNQLSNNSAVIIHNKVSDVYLNRREVSDEAGRWLYGWVWGHAHDRWRSDRHCHGHGWLGHDGLLVLRPGSRNSHSHGG